MTHIHRRAAGFGAWLAAGAIAVGLVTAPGSPLSAAEVKLTETGSTLMHPLFERWAADYPQVAPGVNLTTAATDSGAGLSRTIEGKTTIGATDAYMSDREVQQNPGILEIPLAIAAQSIHYNVPGLNKAGLKLDGPTIARIYLGRITSWDAPEIAALNPGVTLPHETIVPIRRADASGDTFIFTQFLDFSTETCENQIGYGSSVQWPDVKGERTATDNHGMMETAAATPFSIAYIGISFHDAAEQAGLGTARLKNQTDNFVLPTVETIDAAASVLDPRTPPNELLTLVFAPGERSYPLVNYEYAVVAAQQPDADTAAALRDFLRWAISREGGNAPKYLDAVRFVPLPDYIRALSQNQIAEIK